MTSQTERAAISRARSPRVRAWLEDLQPRHLIGGRWVPSQSGETIAVVDPTSETVLAVVASGQAEDVNAAVAAARMAFESGSWPRSTPFERSRLLRRYAELIEQNTDELAELESLNNGMVLDLAKSLIATAVDTIHYYAGATHAVGGETVASSPEFFNYTLREPLGVCGAITPWNGPLNSALQKIGPALAVGNTVVLKPAEQTPLTALRLGELAIEAGFPPGVLNIVTGYGETAGASLVDNLDVDKIAFTGSTTVGKQILAASSGNLKRVTLELGGKSPTIVFPDADLEAAVSATMMGYSVLTGQVCCAGTRVFVQRDFKDQFVDALVRFTNTIKLGDPLDADTTMGPLASREQFERVQGYLRLGVAEGAIARTGGECNQGTGYFVQPTVFDAVNNSMRIAQEEIFGPVVSVIAFEDEDDAVRQANDTKYGLSASVWTSDLTRAHVVARRIRAGTVYVNNILSNTVTMPFGGFKQSGVGREGGPSWYEHYTEEKAVILRL